MKLYRYVEYVTGSGWLTKVQVQCHEFNVTKETPCGYWIEDGSTFFPRWVKKNAHKSYACVTKELARESFYKRKARQIKILTEQLRRATLALNTPINTIPI